jgi:tRNA U38,U39,U40 pseudouridine synthase TruA
LWKIYQFIPIGEFGKKNKNELYIDEKNFLNATAFIKNKKAAFKTILSTEEKRSGAYFFLEADGRVFCPEILRKIIGAIVSEIFLFPK